MIPDFCAENNTPHGTINKDAPEGFVSNRKNGLDGPVAELRVVPRGRPPIWRPLDGGYAVHPDGRVRDRHRHIVTDVAIIEALVPVKRLFLTLACCGARVDTRHPLLALEHYGPCMARLVAEDVGWKTQPTVRLSERYEPRDPTVRQPRARGAYLDPLVRFVNGSGHSKFLPWGRAIQMAGLSHAQNMSATTTLGGDSALSKAG